MFPKKRCVAKEWRKKVRLAKVAKEKAIKSKRAAARWRKNGCIYVCIRGISRDRGEGVKQCHFLWVTMHTILPLLIQSGHFETFMVTLDYLNSNLCSWIVTVLIFISVYTTLPPKKIGLFHLGVSSDLYGSSCQAEVEKSVVPPLLSCLAT